MTADIRPVLEKLEQLYHTKVDPNALPGTMKDRFYIAASRFSTQPIDGRRVNIAEEIGDIVYQVLKLVCCRRRILTPELQRAVFDQYQHQISGVAFRIPIDVIYRSALGLVRNETALEPYLPESSFPARHDTAKAFLANQYVAYVSRLIGGYTTGGAFQTEGHIAFSRIPEETVELLYALNKDLAKVPPLRELGRHLEVSAALVRHVNAVVEDTEKTGELMQFLQGTLAEQVSRNLTLEAVLEFTLFKLKARQELTFLGHSTQSVQRICKPAEYVILAAYIDDPHSLR